VTSGPDVPVFDRFQPLSRVHAAAVAEIERNSSPAPWSARQVEEEIGKSHSRGWVALSPEERVLGFGVYWLVAGEAQLANLAVSPAFRRRGLGGSLLAHLMTEARRESALRMTLEAREGNLPARRLYENMGFFETGRRPGFYDGLISASGAPGVRSSATGRETAVLMEKIFDPSP